MELTLKICEDGKEWDSILNKCPYATVFHKWDFLKVMEKHSFMSFLGKRKARLYPIIGFEKGRTIGIFPLFFYKTPLLRAVFSPAQRSAATYMGPLLLGEEEKNQSRMESLGFEFVRKVDRFMKSVLKANIIKIQTSPNIFDSRSFIWNNYEVTPLYNYEIDLTKGLDSVWNSFEEDLRKSIDKTSSKGYHVEEGNQKDFDNLLPEVFKRYKEQCIKPEAEREYLFDIFRLFYPQNLKVFAVQHNGEYVTGSICLPYQEKILTWIGSPKTSVKGVYPNDLLKWKCIEWASNNGFNKFELTWANTQRLCKYKSKYNPKPTIYFSCEKYSPLTRIIYSSKKLIKGEN